MIIQKELRSLLQKLPHKFQVEFALYCAKDVQHLAREKDKAVVGNVIRVTELWLIGKATADECFDASSAVSSVASSVASSAVSSAASNAAYVASYAAHVPSYAAHAASSASFAADAASFAAYAASHAASYSVAYDKELLKYLNYLKEMIESMPEVERLLLNLIPILD